MVRKVSRLQVLSTVRRVVAHHSTLLVQVTNNLGSNSLVSSNLGISNPVSNNLCNHNLVGHNCILIWHGNRFGQRASICRFGRS